MNLFKNLIILGSATLLWQCSTSDQEKKRLSPNILIIIADDLGYSDLGCYGSEIDTENIDGLAADGILFSNFYASPNCSPSRAMLMSGMDHHRAGIGAMATILGPNQKGKPGYEGFLNNRTVAFSELLKDVGYRTYYSGKWHLGTNEIANPNARGFDKAWWQVGGAPGSHFDWSPPNPSIINNYFENDVPQTEAAENLFSTNFYTDQLISYIEEETDKSKPFLGILSFSAVHIPIHCPESHIDIYEGKYKEGYEALRQSRLLSQKDKGIIPNEIELSESSPNTIPWEELTPEAQLHYARRMEVYAGMVDNMDDNVGKLLTYLKSKDKYENTLIFFMSDNGGAGFNGWRSQGGQNKYAAADNSVENWGREGSMGFIGEGWGSATSTPFRLFKRHISEGGLRIPMIVAGGYLDNKIEKGKINHHIFTIRDIAPTIQDIVGIDYPSQEYKGRSILPQTGKSFSAILKDKPTHSIHDSSEVFGWELFKRKAVQKDKWKILWIEPDFGTGQWELYDLREDPTEKNDLARSHPEKLEELKLAWEQYQLDNNVIISDGEISFP